MKTVLILTFGIAWLSCIGCVSSGPSEPVAISRVAFGSCIHEGKPELFWDALIASEPDVFLLIGDAMYADVTDPALLRQAYETFDANPDFNRLRDACPVLMTWDDHDYGLNDGGADHPHRAEAQSAFLDLAGEAVGSPRREQEGVYTAQVFGPPGRRVQVILLDTRYHRTPLRLIEVGANTTVVPTNDPAATVLGEAQWQWLEKQLRVPAELRLIASSIQVINDEHPFEKWSVVGQQRLRLYQTLRESNQPNIVLLSGDQHLAELSRDDNALAYPLYDFTSSGLNNARGWEVFPNSKSVAKRYFKNHFTLIDIAWEDAGPHLTLRVRDASGEPVFDYMIEAGELCP